MTFKFFHLNPECYLVLGENKSVIHNLFLTQVIWLDDQQTDIICKAEKGEPIYEENEFLNELENQGWGFFADKHYYVDKIRTKNLFSEKQFYKERPRVLSANLHLTNSCNLECNFCGENYCPSCLKYGSNQQMNVEDAINIMDSLCEYELRQIVLCGGEPALYHDLSKIIKSAKQRNINVLIVTNGIKKITEDLKEVQLIINIFSQTQMEKVEKNYKNMDNIIVQFYYGAGDMKLKNSTWQKFIKSLDNPNITTKSMSKLNVMEFDAAKYNNRCLQSRIHIMNNLDVITCLGDQTLVGNLHQDKFYEVINKLYHDQWKKCKATDETMGCGNCEFRYSCSPCIQIGRHQNCSVQMAK